MSILVCSLIPLLRSLFNDIQLIVNDSNLLFQPSGNNWHFSPVQKLVTTSVSWKRRAIVLAVQLPCMELPLQQEPWHQHVYKLELY